MYRQRVSLDCKIAARERLGIEVPVSSSVPFRELAGEFQFRLHGVDSAFRTGEAQQYLRPPPAVVAVKESREPG
jgi:hypothetical protein